MRNHQKAYDPSQGEKRRRKKEAKKKRGEDILPNPIGCMTEYSQDSLSHTVEERRKEICKLKHAGRHHTESPAFSFRATQYV